MENDLISRSALAKMLSTFTMTITGLRAGKGVLREYMTEYRKSVLRIVDEAPAFDAVEIVRCKDCKFAYINSFSAVEGVALCRKLSSEAGIAIRNAAHFCSYGERRTDDGK